ncbi:MAG TPA: 23S rRNA (guanosine(2251)-2'-O)-methyltransferase RlmB [Pyrinomonadaceae bacterium]
MKGKWNREKGREKIKEKGEFEAPRRGNAEKKQTDSRNENFRFKNEDARFGNENSRLSNADSQLVFGVLPVLESLRADARRVEKIYVAEGAREKRLAEIFDLARASGVSVNKTTRENLARMVAPDANHQGVVAVKAAANYIPADEIFDSVAENALLVVLDGVEDPRNLGAILRTVEGAGADGVFIPERRAVGLTETVAKSSAGAVEYVKVAKVANVNRLIDELKERNIWTIGTSAEAEKDYTDWDWTQASALVLGGEGKGLHRLTAEKCDVLVKIPMHGQIESLNVSVACGVILFEANRQRKEKAARNE